MPGQEERTNEHQGSTGSSGRRAYHREYSAHPEPILGTELLPGPPTRIRPWTISAGLESSQVVVLDLGRVLGGAARAEAVSRSCPDSPSYVRPAMEKRAHCFA